MFKYLLAVFTKMLLGEILNGLMHLFSWVGEKIKVEFLDCSPPLGGDVALVVNVTNLIVNFMM